MSTRITGTRLRQIIKEEVKRAMVQELFGFGEGEPDKIMKDFSVKDGRRFFSGHPNEPYEFGQMNTDPTEFFVYYAPGHKGNGLSGKELPLEKWNAAIKDLQAGKAPFLD